MSKFTVIAHRGDQRAAPELTIPAFRAAMDRGFPHMELDVQLTSDGIPIVLHDEILGRTIPGSGAVAQHTWAQLKDLDAGGWWCPGSPDWSHCRIPTLESVLLLFGRTAHLHIELKSEQPTLAAAIQQCLSGAGLLLPDQATAGQPAGSLAGGGLEWAVPGITLTSFHLHQLTAAKRVMPGMRLGWLVQGVTDAVLQAAQEAGMHQLCPRADLLQPEHVQAAMRLGLSVRAWGCKGDKELMQAWRAGAGGATHDFPEHAAALLAAAGAVLQGAPRPAQPAACAATSAPVQQTPDADGATPGLATPQAGAPASYGVPAAAPAGSTAAGRPADFRSDTVTRPGPAMLAAMMAAPVGDDVWGDDPTVNELQAFAADLFGCDAALYCPSGTMTNQIAIKVHTQPGDELICADTAHVFCYEGGGIAFNSGVQARTLPADRGRLTAEQINKAINADDQHYPRSSLVCLENSTNKGGGAIYRLDALQDIAELCRSKGLKLHLDGARVFNAIVASRSQPDAASASQQLVLAADGSSAAGYGPRDLGKLFDSISVCLSKGLGCPVGSLLLGSAPFIARARRIRKVLGGGMRQAGFLAAAGLYALRNNVDRLADDHRRAQQLAAALAACSPAFVESVAPVTTNIVIWTVPAALSPQAVAEAMATRGVLISGMGGQLLRLVTHHDVDDTAIAAACQALLEVEKQLTH